MNYIKLEPLKSLPNTDIKWNSFDPEPLESLGYTEKIIHAKNSINSVNVFKWIKTRKATNLYEFSISNRHINFHPISRAFFKLWEMLVDHSISINTDCLCLAESPGGFIQAILKYTAETKKCYTMSLNTADYNTPTYHYRIKENKMVSILYGYDNSGDLYNPLNKNYLKENIKTPINFITADGGMDDNGFYDRKEVDHYRLILSEIYYALDILEQNGTFIIKIFDIFTKTTFDIITLLTYAFEECYIVKPETSRPTNSEKYILCKKYNKSTYTITGPILEQLVNTYKTHDIVEHASVLQSIFSEEDSLGVLQSQVKRFTEYITKKQIENIQYNIQHINDFTDTREQKEKTFQDWTLKYKLFS